MRAILPAAGRGTRMAAVTGGAPKENLPLGGGSVLELVAREAAGHEVALVWSGVKGPVPLRNVAAFDQPEPLGLGDAVRQAVSRDEPVLVLLPDVVFAPSSPLERLVSALDAGADFAVAVEEVSPERAGMYGIVEIAGDEDWRIERMIEKPSPGQTASRWAVASRYALGPAVVARLRSWPQGEEFGLTEVLQRVLDDGGIGLAVPVAEDEIRYDCGSPEGYSAARGALG